MHLDGSLLVHGVVEYGGNGPDMAFPGLDWTIESLTLHKYMKVVLAGFVRGRQRPTGYKISVKSPEQFVEDG